MITRYRAWLDGHALDEIADSIYITDIVEPETQVEVISIPLAGRSGSRLQSNHRRSKTVLIQLMIREYDVAARKAVLRDVLTWAQGEVLKINDRDGLVLYVHLDNVPQISSLKWTETITLSFTAWDVPYWQSSVLLNYGANGVTTRTFSLRVIGAALSPLDFTVSNTGTETVTDVTVSVDDQSHVHFTNLELLPGESLVYSHDEHGFLTAKIGEQSVWGKLTDDSNDELMVGHLPQIHTVTVTASAIMTVIISVRRRYL